MTHIYREFEQLASLARQITTQRISINFLQFVFVTLCWEGGNISFWEGKHTLPHISPLNIMDLRVIFVNMRCRTFCVTSVAN